MIRKELSKRGLWVFVLALISFLAINHRLNSLEKYRQDQLEVAAKVFAAEPGSAGASRIIIQNNSKIFSPEFKLKIRAEKQLLEYQPALPYVAYTFKREGDSIILSIDRPKIERDEYRHLKYTNDLEVFIPDYLKDITLRGIRATIDFQQEIQLNNITISAENSSIEIRDINANLLKLRDLAHSNTDDKDKDKDKDKSSITLSIHKVNRLDASLSNTDLTFNKADAQSIESIDCSAFGRTTINASPAILQKIIWNNTPNPQRH